MQELEVSGASVTLMSYLVYLLGTQKATQEHTPPACVLDLEFSHLDGDS